MQGLLMNISAMCIRLSGRRKGKERRSYAVIGSFAFFAPTEAFYNMSNKFQTEALVMGAGPVGMLTALLLSQTVIKTRIIDQESCTAGHSCSRAASALDQIAPRSWSRLQCDGIGPM
jgi:hypothetical protein